MSMIVHKRTCHLHAMYHRYKTPIRIYLGKWANTSHKVTHYPSAQASLFIHYRHNSATCTKYNSTHLDRAADGAGCPGGATGVRAVSAPWWPVGLGRHARKNGTLYLLSRMTVSPNREVVAFVSFLSVKRPRGEK